MGIRTKCTVAPPTHYLTVNILEGSDIDIVIGDSIEHTDEMVENHKKGFSVSCGLVGD